MPDSTTGALLSWLRLPTITTAGAGIPLADIGGLPCMLADVMHRELGYSELFPVQAAVWRDLAGGLSSAHDMCISAPTGSGKTLAYALPVVHGTAHARAIPLPTTAAAAAAAMAAPAPHLLQALVVLPTRDLAAQVFRLFDALCPCLGLRAGLAAAQASVQQEAAAVVGRASQGGFAGVDVLVATPGRLMAHLQHTPGFSLRALRFLVVDETDRLLRQSYQEWLPHVLEELPGGSGSSGGGGCRAAGSGGGDARHGAWGAGVGAGAAPLLPCNASGARVVKLIVSATLTRDPGKLARLALHSLRYIALTPAGGGAGAGAGAAGTDAGGGKRYSLPAGLQQRRVMTRAADKPLALVALLHELAGQSTLVFASSVDTTHKLFLMLAAVPGLPTNVLEHTGRLPPAVRAANLASFRAGAAGVLVASDAMARGMDVVGVSNVVNYDAPVYPKGYVHRAGRTARAGRTGRVYTLLRREDMHHFKALLRKLDGGGGGGAGEVGVGAAGGAAGSTAQTAAPTKGVVVREHRLGAERLEELRPALQAALAEVRILLEAEAAENREQQAQRQQAQRQRQRQQQQGVQQARARPTQQGRQLLATLALFEQAAAETGVHNSIISCSQLQAVRSAKTAAARKKPQQQSKGGKKGAAPPKKKPKSQLASKTFDEKDAHMQRIVSMLMPAQQAPAAAAAAAGISQSPAAEPGGEAAVRANAFRRLKLLEHIAWQRDITTKLRLKREALAALPPELRQAAEVEDLAPFPLTRHFYYDSPPRRYLE